MKPTLLLDVGAGTLDLMWTDGREKPFFKAVAASPVVTMARRIERIDGPLIVGGREMGGGPVSRALVERARRQRVVMTIQAAATIHNDPRRVRERGIEVVTPEQAAAIAATGEFTHLELGDIDRARILSLLDALGVAEAPRRLGICLQDHGRAPAGTSQLEYRHRSWVQQLEREPRLERLLIPSTEIDETFSRLRSAAAEAALLEGIEDIWLMDSGMAAVLGGWQEAAARGAGAAIIVDVATSHTMAALVEAGRLCGFFEMHTSDLEPSLFDEMIDALLQGRLEHRQVVSRGGHGAWQGRAPAGRPQLMLLVGPQRRLLAGSRHPFMPGAPLGDNMMAGCAGLLAALESTPASAGHR
ncbi:MAG: pyruvate formate-lyase activating enzyme [Deltaproteobacteria bacterium]|nr:MAG: pyruvate formate-lyase activating enzyme [Deltaproteobacteria bacterium]